MSRQRLFEREVINDGARRVTAYRIRCARCGVLATVNGSLPPEIIAKKFVAKGWHVGKTHDADLCQLHRKEPLIKGDHEKAMIDRVITSMHNFEDALIGFSKLQSPKSAQLVITAIEAFKARVFGD